MSSLTVGNLDEEIVRRLRIRAARNGRSTETEHREILRSALGGGEPRPLQAQVADRLAEFRRMTTGRGSLSGTELLAETRRARTAGLAGPDKGA